MENIIKAMQNEINEVDNTFSCDCDFLDNENVVLNISGNFTEDFLKTEDYEKLNEIHYKYGILLREYLDKNVPSDGRDWVFHDTEGFFYDADGCETDGLDEFETMQYMFYWG